jgi:uncharacterized membrane protein
MLVSVLGWSHGAASVLAMILGAAVLFGDKGTVQHRKLGLIYVLTLAFVCASSLGIYRLNKFWFPHWTAIATLVVIAGGWLAVHYKWPGRAASLHIHMTSMLASYYLLLGGAVNEAFLRIAPLHNLAPRLHAIAFGSTHSALLLAFVFWILWVNAFMAGRRSLEVAQ